MWVKIRRGLIVGDIEAAAPTEIEKTMRALQRLAARFGIHQVLVSIVEGYALLAFL